MPMIVAGAHLIAVRIERRLGPLEQHRVDSGGAVGAGASGASGSRGTGGGA